MTRPTADGRPSRRSPAVASRRHRHRRLGRLGTGIAVVVALLVARLVVVQVLSGARYASYGQGESQQQVALPASRGAIYDRNGNLLAASVSTSDVVADDFQVAHPATEATELSRILHVPASSLASELSRRSGYVVLAKDQGTTVVNALAALAPAGITFQPTSERVAPDSALLEPLLGGLGSDGAGVAGLEEMANAALTGVPGSEVVATAPGGSRLPVPPTQVVRPRPGSSLVLTIDEPLQEVVTRDVAAEMVAQHARSGVAVVEDVRSGAILAMVDLVTSPKGTIEPAPQNLAVTSVYEPGSVMKVATFAYALKDGIVSPGTVLTVPYSTVIGGYTFEDAEYHPTQPMAACEVLAQSSNIGTIEIAHDLGMGRLHAAMADLGFGRPTGLGWPGESQGILGAASSWTGSDQGSVPIGLGEAVTPLQILDAYSAIANGGVAETPHLVASTVAGTAEHRLPAAPGHRVLPDRVARELVPMFESVVQDGTAVDAQVPGYAVAGKTGTSQQPSPTGGYIPGDWNASFVGFVPAQAPKLSAIVTINHPRSIYGGSVAAPVFSKIMQYALRHFDIPPPSAPAPPACTGAGGSGPSPR